MRNLVIFGGKDAGLDPTQQAFPPVDIDNVPVRSGIVHTNDTRFAPQAPGQAQYVFVRVRAFSCNYRDKRYIRRMQDVTAHRYFAIGSEFVGEVIDTGAAVTTLKPGDRVIANNHYTGQVLGADGVLEGVATNQASKEYQVHHEKKLIKIPETMPDAAAACFGLNAQTAYSMVRRLSLKPGARVLVTSGASNTSLFAIGGLMQHDVTCYASTTSPQFDERLRALGVAEILHLTRNDAASNKERFYSFAADHGPFDAVLDPFYNLHIEPAVEVLVPFGTYVTCGQMTPPKTQEDKTEPIDFKKVMKVVMVRNLSLVGNCIGLREDLEQALADYTAGTLEVVIDSIFTDSAAASFLHRTYSDRARFGKTIFQYD